MQPVAQMQRAHLPLSFQDVWSADTAPVRAAARRCHRCAECAAAGTSRSGALAAAAAGAAQPLQQQPSKQRAGRPRRPSGSGGGTGDSSPAGRRGRPPAAPAAAAPPAEVAAPLRLSDAQLLRWERDGFLVTRRCLPPASVEGMRPEVEGIVEARKLQALRHRYAHPLGPGARGLLQLSWRTRRMP
jgi:hypothetical protein